MAKRAVLYARVSKDDRDNDGRNLESQIEMGREYARKAGYTVVAELAEDDRGASGADFDLPMLAQALNMARGGDFDVLIVRELDRFARKLTKQLTVEENFKRTGVQIEYVLGEYPDTPEGRLNKHIRATIAEWEREKITERMTRGRQNAVKAGSVLVHGHAAFGYRSEGQAGKSFFRLVIDEEEARVVRLIYTLYVHGDGVRGPLGMGSIAKHLTALHIPTRWDRIADARKRRPAGCWSTSSVQHILSREVYAGIFHYGKHAPGRDNPPETWLSVEVPAIIDRATWEAAQERRQKNRDLSKRNTKGRYLLRRRVTCGVCGLSATATARGPRGYYNCNSRGIAQPVHKCGLPYFRSDHVDFTVWTWLKGLLSDPEALARGLQEQHIEHEKTLQPWRERRAIVNDLLADNRRQLKKLLDLYLSGDFDKSLLITRKAELEKTIAGLESEHDNLGALLAEREFSAEQVQTVQELAAAVRADLALADDPEAGFSIRERIVDLLNVTAILKVEDGERVLYAVCKIDWARLSVASQIT